jgi:hypothetical protein
MEAERLPDGRVRFLVSRAGFSQLMALLAEAKLGMRKKGGVFPARVGISVGKFESLQDELLRILYGPLGYPRPLDSWPGKLRGPTEAPKTDQSWDSLPKLEAEVLPDQRVALTLSRGELAIFASAVEAALNELAPTRSGWGASEFKARQGLTVEEAEGLMNELRRLDQETRVDGSS